MVINLSVRCRNRWLREDGGLFNGNHLRGSAFIENNILADSIRASLPYNMTLLLSLRKEKSLISSIAFGLSGNYQNKFQSTS